MTRTVNAAFDVQPSLAELNNNLFPHKRGSGCPWKIISLRSESVQHHVLFMLWNEQPTKLDQVFFAAIVRCFEGEEVQTADFVDWNLRRDGQLKTPELESHRASFQSKAGGCSHYTAAAQPQLIHTGNACVCLCIYEKMRKRQCTVSLLEAVLVHTTSKCVFWVWVYFYCIFKYCCSRN